MSDSKLSFGGIMPDMNVFRILGDVSHTASKCILIWAIHSNKSSEGVSLITQILYIAVFTTRYLDLFWVPPSWSWWNFVIKNFYIWSSIYIIILMTRVYARTREREKGWKLGAYAVGGSLVAAPFVTMIFEGLSAARFTEMLWTFSIILESVCVLPQLLLLRQTTVPTVIDSFYLLTLGSYRAFYILNWIVKAATKHTFDPISVIFGVIQTAFYVDFAWVYWTRQRVKLRGGGVVDSEDLRKGWLVNKIINTGRQSIDADVEDGQAHSSENATQGSSARPAKPSRWGARGVSVSADDTLDEHQQKHKGKMPPKDINGNQEESRAILEEDDGLFSDGEDDAPILGSHDPAVVNSNREWGTGPAGRR